MIDNKIRYEVDGSGGYIALPVGSVRALTDYTSIVELVSPLPLDTSVMVNFLVYDARNVDLPLFMAPNGKKGWQVSNNPLVADWNVWEVGIDQTALTAIAKYRAGRIGVSFTFRERRPSKNAITYKGVFNEFNELPTTGVSDGDYYVCKSYNLILAGVKYTYNDNAVWQSTKWVRDRNMRTIATTSTTDLPVDPALLANIPEVPEQDIADLIAQWGGGFIDMQTHINDEEIHVSPADRENWSANKADKIEVRKIGETIITYNANHLPIRIESPSVIEEIEYDINEEVSKVITSYVDGKKYEETYIFSLDGLLTNIMKEEVA